MNAALALTCSARLALQGQAVSQADSMLPEFPATPPTLTQGERVRNAAQISQKAFRAAE